MSATNNFVVHGSSARVKGSNVPIGHLDYNYVKDCTNAKELEEIIQVLRSGSEGYYPDLVEFTEKKLSEINPKSEVLRKEKSAPSVKDLNDDDKKAVTEDLLDWMKQANDMDKKLKDSNAQTEANSVDGLPPIRSKETIGDSTNSENVLKGSTPVSKKRVKPRDFTEWDKFDVDKELENLDKKDVPSKPKVNEGKSSVKIQPVAETKGLDAKERLFRATKEKEKGNEAFRAQDYEEAVVYYTNSLKYEPTAASYNNRAAAALKIEKYSEAIEDCNKVLELEPNNLKAFVRRGIAYKALKQYEMAVQDFNSILQIEPNNKRAKDLLAEIEASKRETVQSEEKTESKTTNQNDVDVKFESGIQDIAGAEAKKKGQRIKIEEIDSSDDVMEESQAAEVSTKGSENEQNNNGDLPDQVKEKGVLDDYVVVNGDKLNLEEIPMDVKVTDNLIKDVNPCVAPESTEEPKNTYTSVGETSESDTQNQLAEMEKQSVVLELPDKVKSLMKEGNDLYKMGHHSEALEKYSKCVENLWSDRKSYASAVSSLFNNKAACYFKMGDCKQCVLECNQSLQLIEDNIKALTRRGMAYETMEKYAEAFRDFNRVKRIDGSNTLAQEHCSRVVKHLEMVHGKSWRKKIFQMSGADESKDQTFSDVDMSTNNASSVEMKDDKKLPEKVNQQPENSLNAGGAEKSVVGESQEESGASMKTRFLKMKESGNLLVKKGKHEEAIKHYTDCIQLCPEEVAVYTNRALCYLNLSKFELAETDCNSALKIQKDNVKALFRRGKARKGLGRYREASEDLVQVLKLDSKNGTARSELTTVLALLKQEKKNEEKSKPERKKILIQDVDGEDDNTSAKAAQKQSSKSTAKIQEIPDAAEQKNNKTKESRVSQKQKTKAKNSSAKAGQKETPKAKEECCKKCTKQNGTAPLKYNLKSAFQFVQAWQNVKSSSEHLNIMKQVNLADLPKLISKKLDADMIKSMIEALHLEVKNNGDVKFVHQFLQALMLVERFDMTLMFLSTPEKEALRKLFDDISKQNKDQTDISNENISQLRKKYQV